MNAHQLDDDPIEDEPSIFTSGADDATRAKVARIIAAFEHGTEVEPTFVHWGAAEAILAALNEPDGAPTPDSAPPVAGPISFAEIVTRLRDWSIETFGPGPRVPGTLDHIRLELDEIAAAPDDVIEWVDVALLALDGAWRAGHSPEAIAAAAAAKIETNRARTWPDWRTLEPGAPVQHIRPSDDASPDGNAGDDVWPDAMRHDGHQVRPQHDPCTGECHDLGDDACSRCGSGDLDLLCPDCLFYATQDATVEP